jgi:hypothetical protein
MEPVQQGEAVAELQNSTILMDDAGNQLANVKETAKEVMRRIDNAKEGDWVELTVFNGATIWFRAGSLKLITRVIEAKIEMLTPAEQAARAKIVTAQFAQQNGQADPFKGSN